MADLPRPIVNVTTHEADAGHVVDVFIHRDNKGKTYTGTAPDRSGAIREVVEKIIGDGATTEWIPRG